MKTAMPQFTIALLIVCLASVQNAQAVSPAPDGGYSGGNTAEGQDALLHLTTGVHNTAVGFLSLKSDTTGSYNTAIGSGTLRANRSDANTATGTFALLNNTGGRQNTANGALALLSNTSGNVNTAVGYSALVSNTVGFQNTAIGDSTLGSNTTGNNNTASGSAALSNNTTGDGNTATGFGALNNNGTGGGNTAVGYSALSVNQSGIVNIALGFHAGDLTTGDNNIVIGSRGVQGESNTIRIGGGVFGYGPQTAAFIAGISGTAVVGDAVVVDGNGQLGTVASSARFKKNIKPMDKTSEAILALKPVSFQYRSDSKGTPQFGLIAEEVAKVNPELVVRNRNGEIYSVRYDQVNAMLLNEFLKEHRTVQEQGATITELKKQVEALSAGLQRVNAQLQLNKPAPKMAKNNN
ncbi:MAG: tail fiber domain-containing protein [Chthoniobacterales bacterium]